MGQEEVTLVETVRPQFTVVTQQLTNALTMMGASQDQMVAGACGQLVATVGVLDQALTALFDALNKIAEKTPNQVPS